MENIVAGVRLMGGGEFARSVLSLARSEVIDNSASSLPLRHSLHSDRSARSNPM
jgi:hypothetical protein